MPPPIPLVHSVPVEHQRDSDCQSSRNTHQGSDTPTTASPTPSEATPTEESVLGVRSFGDFDIQSTRNITRKFKPQLIETSHSRRGQRLNPALPTTTQDDGPNPTTGPKRFAPDLVETPIPSVHFESTHTDSCSTPSPLRRVFTPQLVESAKRTRKSTDTKPALTYADRTDVSPVHEPSVPPKSKQKDHLPLISSPIFSILEARKLGVPLPSRTLSQSSSHSHSFKSPGLETIDSSESDSSNQASPITSVSPSFSSASFSHTHRGKDSIDNRSTGYLLALAAKNAQRQLREQALAAFPNDDRHEPILHYVDRAETPAPSSRGSQYELDLRRYSSNWELKELQKHHEMLEADREKEKKRREARRKFQKELNNDPWKVPIHDLPVARRGPEWDDEHQKMLEKARPPMLGKDLVFPRSDSPDPARFDVTQGAESLKRTMCYLSNLQERSEPNPSSLGGLWCAQAPPKPESVASYQWSRPASRTPSQQGGGGLWGGSCVEAGLTPPADRPTGIMTPRFEEDFSNNVPIHVLGAERVTLPHQLPPSPPPSNSGITSNLEERLEAESAIDAEFNDEFITQVYNYLSLGYPAVARDFDEELSKISRIPISELRQDDDLPTGARGYIRLGEEALCNGVTEDMCLRWKALRLYVVEWARQQPNMAKPQEVQGNWVAARKDSWAL